MNGEQVSASQVVFAMLMGFSLAATCGLRAFLPLFVISLGSNAGFIHLSSSFEWMQSWPALLCFGTGTVLELLGDKIPAVDHLLDAAGSVIRPTAGAVAASSMIQGFDPLLTLVLGIVMGGTVAGFVHMVKSTFRLMTSLFTAGLGNPVVSMVEDGAAFVGGVIAIFLPYITAAVTVVLLVWGVKWSLDRMKKKKALQTS